MERELRGIDSDGNGTDGGKSVDESIFIPGWEDFVASDGSSNVGSIVTASTILYNGFYEYLSMNPGLA